MLASAWRWRAVISLASPASSCPAGAGIIIFPCMLFPSEGWRPARRAPLLLGGFAFLSGFALFALFPTRIRLRGDALGVTLADDFRTIFRRQPIPIGSAVFAQPEPLIEGVGKRHQTSLCFEMSAHTSQCLAE